jgi:hypothetical protein
VQSALVLKIQPKCARLVEALARVLGDLAADQIKTGSAYMTLTNLGLLLPCPCSICELQFAYAYGDGDCVTLIYVNVNENLNEEKEPTHPAA